MIRWVCPSSRRRMGKPRASGDDPLTPKIISERPGVNPARAGMIPSARGTGSQWTGKPRASGDDPIWDVLECRHCE